MRGEPSGPNSRKMLRCRTRSELELALGQEELSMAQESKGPAGRREFIKDAAAAGAAAFIADSDLAGAHEGHPHDHQHEHQAVPSDVALRVKALESVLVEKGMVNPPD